jgi:hypothetical protein
VDKEYERASRRCVEIMEEDSKREERFKAFRIADEMFEAAVKSAKRKG